MLLQCLRLLLAALSLWGWASLLRRRCALSTELSLFTALSAIGLFTFMAGCFGALLWAVWGIFAAGLLLFALTLRRRERVAEVVTPGFVLLCLLCAVFFVILYGSIFSHVDNFSHWAAATKRLLELDRFPVMGDRLVYLTSYQLGSASLIYYFCRVSGLSADWFQAWVQSVYLISCVCSLFGFIEPRVKRSSVLALILTIFASVCLLCGDTDPCDLLVDTLMPLSGLGGVAMCMYYRGRSGPRLLPLLIVLCFPGAVKNSGFFYSAVIFFFALGCYDRPLRLRRGAVMLGSLAFLYLLWQLRLKLAFPEGLAGYHALTVQSFSSTFSEKTPELVRLILSRFAATVVKDSHIPELLLCSALAAAFILLCANAGRRRLLGLLALSAPIWLGYILCLLGVYLFSMNGGEATSIAAFDRYNASILIFLCGYYWLLCLDALREAGGGSRRALLSSAAALIGCAALLLCLRPRFDYCVPQRLRAPDDWYELRHEFNALWQEYRFPEGMSYIIFSKEATASYVRVLSSYSLDPSTTFVCTEDELPKLGDGWRTYDYYIVLDSGEPFAAFATETFGARRAGATY